MVYILLFAAGAGIFCAYMLIRNELVCRERTRMLARAVPGSPDFWERFAEHNSATYDEMLYQFWKPVKSFYKEFE